MLRFCFPLYDSADVVRFFYDDFLLISLAMLGKTGSKQSLPPLRRIHARKPFEVTKGARWRRSMQA